MTGKKRRDKKVSLDRTLIGVILPSSTQIQALAIWAALVILSFLCSTEKTHSRQADHSDRVGKPVEMQQCSNAVMQ